MLKYRALRYTLSPDIQGILGFTAHNNIFKNYEFYMKIVMWEIVLYYSY